MTGVTIKCEGHYGVVYLHNGEKIPYVSKIEISEINGQEPITAKLTVPVQKLECLDIELQELVVKE